MSLDWQGIRSSAPPRIPINVEAAARWTSHACGASLTGRRGASRMPLGWQGIRGGATPRSLVGTARSRLIRVGRQRGGPPGRPCKWRQFHRSQGCHAHA
eukprot:5556705-Pyramimonas_sp.AAC.1